MPNFKKLAALAVGGEDSATYVMSQVEGSPRLTVRPATEANRKYFNARLTGSRGLARAVRSGGVNTAALAANRKLNRDLYPQHVITGWDASTILDDAGKPVPYSKENCAAFVEALPDHIFDDLMEFCEQPSSFRKDIDIEETAGN